MFEIVRYTADKASAWNVFVAASKNGTFLFDRNYMDYHADRFDDYSLMVYHRQRLFGIMPANRKEHTVFSHQGLTYGGLVIGAKATAADVCEAMRAIFSYLKKEDVKQVIYKALPSIYAELPSDEPLYALTEVCNARLSSRDIASVIDLQNRLPLSELRRRGKNKAIRHGVKVAYSDDFSAFWHILSDNLEEKYHALPVHSLGEIELLKNRFPNHVRLFAAFSEGEMVAGTVLYITNNVIKTQYISASPTGKKIGALDLLFDTLLSTYTGQQRYFDMGTSAMEHSTELRQPLIFQKEGFGGRAVCYDTYEWTL